VLTGTVRSGLDDETIRTFREGESWFEPPGAHHVLTENVSATEHAKLLAASSQYHTDFIAVCSVYSQNSAE